MEVVLEVVTLLAFAVGLIEAGVDVDEPGVLFLFRQGGEVAVELVEVNPLGLARRGTGGGHEDHGGVGIRLAQASEVFPDALDGGFGWIAGVDVVAAAVEDHHARVVGQGDAVHVAEDLGGIRAAEAAVDGRVGLHFFGDVFPHPQRAGAAEQERVLRRWVGLVLLLEGFDVLGHAQGLLGERLADGGLLGGLGGGLFGGLGGVRAEERGGKEEGEEDAHGGEG